MSTELQNIILAKDKDIQGLLFAYFVQQIFRVHPEEHIGAIMAYGSTLNAVTTTNSSTPDFYVLVDDYDLFYSKKSDRFLNRHLPPNIYHIHSPQGSCKYCVISLNHLEKEVGPKTKDVYHLGRFSKRMGIVWARNPEIENRITHIQKTAIISVAKKVLQSLDENFTLDDFIRRCLFLSYQGDVRVEAMDKVEKIMLSEKTYYDTIFQLALDDLNMKKNELGFYQVSKSGFSKKLDRIRFSSFIRRSRTRARLRWPKNIFTVDQWIDYIIAKIERTQGIKIELTPFEKKFWYIFGWKHFFRLSRKKLIK
jgi:hypothetical protein